MKLSDFIPPILYKIKHKFSAKSQGLPRYKSYQDALLDGANYNTIDIASIVAEKTKKVLEGLRTQQAVISNSHILFAMGIVEKCATVVQDKINVIEIGGACGAIYYELKYRNCKQINKWHIVETEKMVSKAVEIADAEPPLFSTTLELAMNSIKKTDLFYIQGTIFCLEHPLETLANICKMNPTYIAILRTITLQQDKETIYSKLITQLHAHGPGSIDTKQMNKVVHTPITLHHFDDYINVAKQNGYITEWLFFERPYHETYDSKSYQLAETLFLFKKIS